MAEEKLERANFYGAEKIITGRGGAAGGSGGGGMALTGGAYVPSEGGITTTNRWLRFNFNDPNHKSLIILGGTTFTIGENIISFDEDTIVDFADWISEEGCDYYVFVNADKRVVASTLRTQLDGYMFIGQFHTLCADCNDDMTVSVSIGLTVKQAGDKITLQNYFKERDLDFYNFYTVELQGVGISSAYYNRGIFQHPLSGFKAMDILPESVWCLNWHPSCKNWDGMVWCNSIEKAVDIYCNSGTGNETRSEYGTPLDTCSWINDIGCKQFYGKSLPIPDEFISYSLGSNQKSVATNSSINGGNSDTLGRRMISLIGCEDCCGFYWQIGSLECSSTGESSTVHTYDGLGVFGKQYEELRNAIFGGTSISPYPADVSGSYAMDSLLISSSYCRRHVCKVVIV